MRLYRTKITLIFSIITILTFGQAPRKGHVEKEVIHDSIDICNWTEISSYYSGFLKVIREYPDYIYSHIEKEIINFEDTLLLDRTKYKRLYSN